MEPRIQYARTTDDVSIAYFSMGSGIPFVAPPPAMPWSHIQMEWNIPEWREWTEKLMRGTSLVRYDGRGSGLSDRALHDCTLETELLDLEAVVDRMGLERFALFGCYHASPVTIAYAAKHPERVSHLVLWCGFAKDDEADNTAQAEVYARLRELDWEMFTETLAHSVLGWSQGEPAHRLAEYMRARSCAATTASCATPCTSTAARKSRRWATASWHRSHLRRVPSSAPSPSSARSRSTMSRRRSRYSCASA